MNRMFRSRTKIESDKWPFVGTRSGRMRVFRIPNCQILDKGEEEQRVMLYNPPLQKLSINQCPKHVLKQASSLYTFHIVSKFHGGIICSSN